MKVTVTKKPCVFAFALCLALLSFACSPENETNPHRALHDIKLGQTPLRVEVAIAKVELSKGLMFRETLSESDGMIFVYPEPSKLTFWMKNTAIPLDIGYLDRNGILREIYPMQPFDQTPVESRRHDIQIALEVPRGWYRQNDIRVGDQLDMSMLTKAIKMRGFDPALLGITQQ